jgi:hypothetical protein
VELALERIAGGLLAVGTENSMSRSTSTSVASGATLPIATDVFRLLSIIGSSTVFWQLFVSLACQFGATVALYRRSAAMTILAGGSRGHALAVFIIFCIVQIIARLSAVAAMFRDKSRSVVDTRKLLRILVCIQTISIATSVVALYSPSAPKLLTVYGISIVNGAIFGCLWAIVIVLRKQTAFHVCRYPAPRALNMEVIVFLMVACSALVGPLLSDSAAPMPHTYASESNDIVRYLKDNTYYLDGIKLSALMSVVALLLMLPNLLADNFHVLADYAHRPRVWTRAKTAKSNEA